MRGSLRLVSFALAAGAALSAHAVNLVQDGNFEQADPGAYPLNAKTYYPSGTSFDGGLWTVTQGTVAIDTHNDYVDAVGGSRKSLDLTGGGLYEICAVSQEIATVAGQKYVVSFDGNADTDNSFSLIFGSPVLGGPSSIHPNYFDHPFSHYSVVVTATTPVTTLTLLGLFTGTSNTVEIDNVSVAAVPEPLPIAALSMGVVATLRRRRKAG